MGKECPSHPAFKYRSERPYQVEQGMERTNTLAQELDMKSRESTESDSRHCSIASSRNYSAIDMSVDRMSPRQTVSSSHVDDAQSSHECANGSYDGFSSEEEVATEVHEKKLYTYFSVLRDLHASGPLSWDQEALLTNLRLSLNVSNDEHLFELRRLCSTQAT